MSQLTTPAGRALAQIGVPFNEFIHDGPLASIAQAADERGQTVDQVVRSLLFRVKDGGYVMVIVAGPRKVSWKALRAYYKQNRLSMPGPDEVLEVTGFEIGAVQPFGLPQPMDVVVDRSVLVHEEISMGSGVRGTGIVMKVKDLLKALGDPPQVDFTEN
jgi:Cys-tRNA(Pro) deacylase